ncbi:MAG: SMP-30/gluconolactonase/LRE family protein [Stellaceae bacterium]
MSGTEAIEVYCDIRCTLGEGPAAHPGLASLFWVDILRRRLLERRFDRAGTVVHELPVMASMVAVIDDGRQLIAADTGLHIRDVKSGALTLLAPLEADNPATRSNDGRVHPSGALWIGTMGREAERGAGTLYWFFKGELRALFGGITVINSIAFAPDGSYAYLADTGLGTIWRIDTDPATGLPLGERRVFHDFGGEEGGPDGSVVDADGILWNARWGGGALDAYAPDGRRLRSLALPTPRTTCPAFVGKNADRLVVTTAISGSDPHAVSDDPVAGQTLLIDLPVRGRFDPPVRIA